MSKCIVFGTGAYKTIITDEYEKTICCVDCPHYVVGLPCEKCRKEEDRMDIAKAVWASEIEEFPVAVTKEHFPEEEREEN